MDSVRPLFRIGVKKADEEKLTVKFDINFPNKVLSVSFETYFRIVDKCILFANMLKLQSPIVDNYSAKNVVDRYLIIYCCSSRYYPNTKQ